MSTAKKTTAATAMSSTKGPAHVKATAIPVELKTKATMLVPIPPSLSLGSPIKLDTVASINFASSVKAPVTLAIQTKPTKSTKLPKVTLLKALPDASRHALERKLSHIFENPNLLWEALQAHGNGITQIGDRKTEDGNKSLALLGDSCLDVAVKSEWVGTGASRREGHELASNIGRNSYLDKCGREAGLEAFINPNYRFLGRGRVIPPRTMSATVEALIGAVFLDSGENLRAVKVAMKGLGLF